ncbi:MAG: adenylosuccinate synthetase [Patescibacteria group bacterium]
MLTIIVGGLVGDEGKGKVMGYLAQHDEPDFVVRAGAGPQAGHTIMPGQKVTLIPSGLTCPSARLLISRGTVINPETLLKEIEEFDIADRIGIDFGCTVIEPVHIAKDQIFKKTIGTVGTGSGPARADKVLRIAKLAKDIKSLSPYLVDTAAEINKAILADQKILVETAQGYGLSLNDYRFYPYVTSQDVIASQFAADMGIGPKAIDEIIVIYKSYVSRVGPGPLPRTEWSVEEIKKRGLEEIGVVSGRPRRIGPFDKELARESLIRNTATQAALTCIDRMFKGNERVTNWQDLTKPAQDFISELNKFFHKHSPYFKEITLISTGPNSEDMIDLR